MLTRTGLLHGKHTGWVGLFGWMGFLGWVVGWVSGQASRQVGI